MNTLFGWALLLVSIFGGILHGKMCLDAHYDYERRAGSFWKLAVKSSTLEEKSKYVGLFYNAISEIKHSEYNAIFYKTPNNNFHKNLDTLLSLKNRLHIIKIMDENSFAYQTAMQQITSQEQGEAEEMLSVLSGCFYLENYWYYWDWYVILLVMLWFSLGITSIMMILAY